MASPRKPLDASDTIEGILDKLDLVSEELKTIQRSLERMLENKNSPGKRPRAAS